MCHTLTFIKTQYNYLFFFKKLPEKFKDVEIIKSLINKNILCCYKIKALSKLEITETPFEKNSNDQLYLGVKADFIKAVRDFTSVPLYKFKAKNANNDPELTDDYTLSCSEDIKLKHYEDVIISDKPYDTFGFLFHTFGLHKKDSIAESPLRSVDEEHFKKQFEDILNHIVNKEKEVENG